MFKKLNPKTKEKEDLKEEVKDNAGDLYNELYYVYQDKYNVEKMVQIQKTKTNLATKNWDSLIITSTGLKKKNITKW